MRVFSEETFGPLGVILTFSDEAEALRYANITNYGLGGSIWTRELGKYGIREFTNRKAVNIYRP